MNLFHFLGTDRQVSTTTKARLSQHKCQPGVSRLEGREMCSGLSHSISITGAPPLTTPPTVDTTSVVSKSSTVLNSDTPTVVSTSPTTKSSVVLTPTTSTSTTTSSVAVINSGGMVSSSS